MEKLKETILNIVAALAILLLANGIFYAAIYLVDSEPLFVNLRYINW